MKIVVLEGSPNKNGSSNMLAAEFIRGAQEVGHSVQVVDAAHAKIHPCIGCISCGYDGICDTTLLLRNECTVKDIGGLFLRIQQQYPEKTDEVRLAYRGMECG